MLKRILATSALALALASPALAQERQPDQMEGQSPTAQQQQAQGGQAGQQQEPDERPMNQVSIAQAESIKGSSVRNQQGEEIGQVEGLVVDVKKGQLSYAIVGVGGFLGVGEKSVAVPWDRLQPGDQPQSFALNVNRQTLEQAPAISTDNLAQLESPEQQQQISTFWEEAANQQAQTPDQPPQQSPQQPER